MAVLLGQSTTGVGSANSNSAGVAFAQKLVASATGTVGRIWLNVGVGTLPTAIHGAIYANDGTGGNIDAATRLSGDIIASGWVAGQWNFVDVAPGVAVTSGTSYWIEWLGITNTFNYTDNATTGGTENDTLGQSTCPATHAARSGTNANIANVYGESLADSGVPRTFNPIPFMR